MDVAPSGHIRAGRKALGRFLRARTRMPEAIALGQRFIEARITRLDEALAAALRAAAFLDSTHPGRARGCRLLALASGRPTVVARAAAELDAQRDEGAPRRTA